jgi:hypothetical protein
LLKLNADLHCKNVIAALPKYRSAFFINNKVNNGVLKTFERLAVKKKAREVG